MWMRPPPTWATTASGTPGGMGRSPPPTLATRPISHSATSTTIANHSNPDKLTLSLLLRSLVIWSCRCAHSLGQLARHQDGHRHEQDVHEYAAELKGEADQP